MERSLRPKAVSPSVYCRSMKASSLGSPRCKDSWQSSKVCSSLSGCPAPLSERWNARCLVLDEQYGKQTHRVITSGGARQPRLSCPNLHISRPNTTPVVSSTAPVLPAQAPRLVVRPAGPHPVMNSPVPRDCSAWIEAARDFELNLDFDIPLSRLPNSGTGVYDFPALMHLMKAESEGKRTIQALADKILLSQLLDNLGVPQLPRLLETRATGEELHKIIEGFLASLEGPPGDAETSGEEGTPICAESMQDEKKSPADDKKSPADEKKSPAEQRDWNMVVKPVHLSNARGVLVFTRKSWHELGYTLEKLLDKVDKSMGEQAGDTESAALRTLLPGLLIQPRYVSAVGYKLPLEVRVTTLWGVARSGIWWWGTTGSNLEAPQRTVWMVRRQAHPSKVSDQDTWEALHEHKGESAGFTEAVRIFTRYMPAMAAYAEHIARGVGAPFLRSDFFVGSPEWGVRLNEVAYGSGIEYRTSQEGSKAKMSYDGPAMAQILQDGFRICRFRAVPEHFLHKLGAKGGSYRDLVVSPLPAHERPPLPAGATLVDDPELKQISPAECQTPPTNARQLESSEACHGDPQPGAEYQRASPRRRAVSLSSRLASSRVVDSVPDQHSLSPIMYTRRLISPHRQRISPARQANLQLQGHASPNVPAAPVFTSPQKPALLAQALVQPSRPPTTLGSPVTRTKPACVAPAIFRTASMSTATVPMAQVTVAPFPTCAPYVTYRRVLGSGLHIAMPCQ